MASRASLIVRLLLAGCGSLGPMAGASADDGIGTDTDRPDFVESPGVAAAGRWQRETSLSFEQHHADGLKRRTWSTPNLLHFNLDSGSAALPGQGLRPSLRFAAEWDLPGGWSVGVRPGAARDSASSGKHILAGVLAATTGRDLAPDLRGFVEVAGQRLASKANGGNLITFDTGLSFGLGPDMQIDLSLVRGLTRSTPDWSFALGWSARY
jgi:hypothetical protein